MSSKMYFNLAISNLKKNFKTYIPYLITCICAVSMYFIMYSLYDNSATGNGTVASFMELGINVLSVFSFIFLCYTNSFLVKQRKKEFGLYNILGMEKKHIARIIFIETLITFLLSLGLGYIIGLLFSKLVFLCLLKIMRYGIGYSFEISIEAFLSTFKLFILVFSVTLISSLWQIKIARPIELLNGTKKGEKEPKSNLLLAIFGFIFIGFGYWVSITTVEITQLIGLFFVAVISVMIGTYLLFISGTVTLIKILKKNKKYYYKPNHFISISGLIYRMKQNGAGLATICLLSTSVLVMISSTATLYVGLESGINERFPTEIAITTNDYTEEKGLFIKKVIDDTLDEFNLKKTDFQSFRFRHFITVKNGTEFSLSDQTYGIKEGYNLIIIPYSDFSKIVDIKIDLKDNQALLYSNTIPYEYKTLEIGGMVFNVIEHFNEFKGFNTMSTYNMDILPRYYMIVKDMDIVDEIVNAIDIKTEINIRPLAFQSAFNLDNAGDMEEEIIEFWQSLNLRITGDEELLIEGWVESRTPSRAAFNQMYGGLFFLGIFLTIIFLIATVLIMYYKQISEGYSDKERYSIMRKVGLGEIETKRAIGSQILTVFFLPLIVACIHIAFAVPSISRLLALLNMVDSSAYVKTLMFCIFAFVIFYSIIYMLTAKVYYKIING